LKIIQDVKKKKGEDQVEKPKIIKDVASDLPPGEDQRHVSMETDSNHVKENGNVEEKEEGEADPDTETEKGK
jgi:hypothetical protein